MTQLKQLLIMVNKEISSKEIMMDKERLQPVNSFYYAGGHSALMYVKHLIDRLMEEEDVANIDNI
jgi:hypothetical protein